MAAFDDVNAVYGGVPAGASVVLQHNAIVGNTDGVLSGPGEGIDAAQNWWGDLSGPNSAANPLGTGDPVSTDVDVDPWLGDGTDTSTDIGFQPNLTPVYYTPSHLLFSIDPGAALQGIPFGTQPVVDVVDVNGGIAQQFQGPVSLDLGTNPSGASLGGTVTVNAGNGQATFTDLSIDVGGTGFTLVASSPNLADGTSAAFNVGIPGTVYVDDDWSGVPVGTDPDGGGPANFMGYDAFAVIQQGVEAVAAAGTVNVADGTYVELVEIYKALDLVGPNAAINPITGTRVAEAVLLPSVSDPDPNTSSVVLIYIGADHVTVRGLKLDGDNPGLTSGLVWNGADIDAIEGISSYEGVGGITLENNILQNLSYAGMDLYNWVNGGGATSDNLVSANLYSNIGTPTYGYGIAVLIYNNFYAEISNNRMVDCRAGVQTGNFYQPNPGPTVPSIVDNEMFTWRRGIFYNLHYGSASPFTITGNTLTAVDQPAAAYWDAMLVSSQQGGVTSTIANNTINGSAATQLTVGFQAWSCPATAGAVLTGGSITGCDYGAWVNNYDGYNEDGGTSVMTLDGVAINGASIAGVYVKDNPLNSNGAVVTADLQNGCSISGSAVGILVDGPDTVLLPGDTAIASVSGDYITLANDAAAGVDATGVGFDGLLGSAMSLGQLFATEDSITHVLDDTSLGLVRVKAGHVYVTPASGSVARGVAACSIGDFVNVADGIYALGGTLTIAKSLTLLGETESGVVLDASGNGLSWGLHVTADDVTLERFTVLAPSDGGGGGGYAFHITPPEPVNSSSVPVANLTLRDLTVNGSARTPFDLHGVDGALLDGLTATGATAGNGIQLTACQNVTLDDCTTSGNAWGGLAIYVSSFLEQGSSTIIVDSSCTFAEAPAIYQQPDGYPITGVTLLGSYYKVDFGGGYESFFNDEPAAVAYASAALYAGYPSTITDPLGDPVPFAVADNPIYVDDNWTALSNGDPVTVGGTYYTIGVNAFAVIQDGVDAVAVAGTVYVLEGTYAENVYIAQAMNLLGPNAGINPNTGSRVAEAVILPAILDVEFGILVEIAASDVTVDGFTLSGDNPALSSGFGYNGADMDASDGIAVYSDNVSNLTVRNNMIRDLTFAAVSIFGGSYSAPSTSGHLVEGNRLLNLGQYDPASNVDFWGIGVLIYNDQYTAITNNFMDDVRVGVQTGNNHDPNPGDPAYQVISGNEIHARRRGIFHNLYTGSPSPTDLIGNTISAIDDPNETVWDGILLASLSTDSLCEDNVIDGSAATVPSEGYEIWNVSAGYNVLLRGGSVSGVDIGVFANNFEGYSSDAGNGAHVTVEDLDIAANGIGVFAFDSSNSTAHAAVEVTLAAGVDIAGGVIGILIDGTNAAVTALADVVLTGQSGDYIALANAAMDDLELDGTQVAFDGQVGSAMALVDLYALEDRMTHALDDAAVGFVRVNEDNVYVTPASGSIQRGIDAAAADDTVNVDNGLFVEQLEIAKDIELIGGGSGTVVECPANLTLSYTTSAANYPVIHVHDTANAVVQGMTVDGDGNGNANYRMLGISYYNAGGAVSDVIVQGVRNDPLDGSQHGIGIYALADAAPARILVVEDCDVFDFQKNGMALSGEFLEVAVLRNRVVGAGPLGVGLPAQNGIQVGFGATGSILSNEVSGIDYTGPDWSAAGILVYEGGVEIANNHVTACQIGVSLADPLASMGEITQNNLSNNIWGISLYFTSGAGFTVLAENNWWGSDKGPDSAANAGGDGSAAESGFYTYSGGWIWTPDDTLLDFSPWLGDGTDTSVDIGFQPNLVPAYATPQSLSFTTQPGDANLGDPLSGQPVVTVLDELGGIATQFQGPVTVALNTNPNGSVLDGTLTVNAVNGVAAFTDLSVSLVGGSGLTLEATAEAPILPATSSGFNIAEPTPTLTSLDPAGIVAGSPDFTLTVSGSGFVPTSVVQWNGSAGPPATCPPLNSQRTFLPGTWPRQARRA